MTEDTGLNYLCEKKKNANANATAIQIRLA